MYLSLYHPTQRALVSRPLDGLFDSLISEYFAPVSASAERPASRARIDLVEAADRYEASLEIPGVKKEEIDVKIEGKRVSITAQAKSGEALKDGERVLYTERRLASYARVFDLPGEVADERAEASYENGVLKLVLPKKEALQAKRLQIN